MYIKNKFEYILNVKNYKTGEVTSNNFNTLKKAIEAIRVERAKYKDSTYKKDSFSKQGLQFSTDDVDVWIEKRWGHSAEEVITDRVVKNWGAVVQVSKYKELCWTYISADSDLYNTEDDAIDYYKKFCKDYPDFTYKDYSWQNSEDEEENFSEDPKEFELFYKGELLLTIYYVGYNNFSSGDVGCFTLYQIPRQEDFEKFIEQYTGEPDTRIQEVPVDESDKCKAAVFLGGFKSSPRCFKFSTFKDACIGSRELAELFGMRPDEVKVI